MPKTRQNKLVGRVLEIVASYPKGASLSDILNHVRGAISTRSLQRLLADLVSKELLEAAGEFRGRRYKVAPKESRDSFVTALSKPSEDALIPLSAAARQVEKEILKPRQKRKHVGYQRKFLDSYCPNVTYYLPLPTRKRLVELGASNEVDQPAGTFARKIFHRLLIDLSWNSSRLEGNTYSLLETVRLLKYNEPSESKDLKETQMILNHKAAIEFLIDPSAKIDRYTILNLHALLANNLLRDSAACGSLRSIPVGISSTTYIPTSIPQFIEECFNQILKVASAIKDPFEQAFFLMVHIPYLQPFEDVNKRVSRLSANIPLFKANLCPLSFVDVPEEAYISGLLGVYELNRVELLRDIFVWAYERSCSLYSATKESLGEPDPFRMRYQEALKEAIQEVIRQKLDKPKAISFLKEKAKAISSADQNLFVETAQNELFALHSGNIARYKITPQEYEEWLPYWKCRP